MIAVLWLNSCMQVRRIGQHEGEVWREVRTRMVVESPRTFADTADELASWPAEILVAYAQRAASGPECCTLFAEEDGSVIGTVSAELNARGVPEVFGLWVARDCRGKGVGSQLMAVLERWVVAETVHDGIELTVNESNDVARHFYESIGYELNGHVHPSKANPGTLALQMRKRIKGAT